MVHRSGRQRLATSSASCCCLRSLAAGPARFHPPIHPRSMGHLGQSWSGEVLPLPLLADQTFAGHEGKSPSRQIQQRFAKKSAINAWANAAIAALNDLGGCERSCVSCGSSARDGAIGRIVHTIKMMCLVSCRPQRPPGVHFRAALDPGLMMKTPVQSVLNPWIFWPCLERLALVSYLRFCQIQILIC